ncbi:MAG TPA: sulfotransferase domain-containing protein [Crenotrichaceae bacterium]|nr:sulfotransferase domain-containing protein [Crenotrichaceae bacterium]
MSAGIFWLASYPKSGNTWMRLFIANLNGEEEEAVDINELYTGSIASGRGWIDDVLGFDIGALSHDEIDQLRPDVYRWSAEQAESLEYHKIHDAYTTLADGRQLIPANATYGVLYLLRNPLDVAISFAHHSNCSIDKAIDNMSNPQFAFCGGTKRLNNQLRQWLLSWSDHVISWVDAAQINRLVVRYEDMVNHPMTTFSKVAGFLELATDENSITQALEHCTIKKLQEQEQEKGFKEKMATSANFFRKGKVGDWQETLSETQIQRIVTDHCQVMQRFGYLDSQGQPLVNPKPIERQSIQQPAFASQG